MTFPIARVRQEFPALALTDAGRARAYLDNPAGTQVPARVAAAVSKCLLESNANLGGHFATSQAAGAVVDGAHQAMADFLGARSAREIVIGPNMTTLTFHLSRSICRDFKPGDEIIVTRMDHEGNISPWLEIAKDKGLTVKFLPFDKTSWQVEIKDLEPLLSERTRLLCLNYASNLTGSINDVKALTRRAHEAGALVFVDAVQFTPHRLVDVQDLDCDFLACSAYKFFGPHLGIVWGREEILRDLYAYKCRCSDNALPHRFETGTPQIELLAGLTATVDYFDWLGGEVGATGSRRQRIAAAYQASVDHEEPLAQQLISGLQAMGGITIAGITNPNRVNQRVPTVSFRHESRKPAAIARALADSGIFVWDGHNYALEVVRHLGINEEEGVVRVGMAHYNTEAEVAAVLGAIRASIAGAG
ncbi:MAG: cysteine desulfurase-like protein [Rhodospirillaceae bacterium]|nr:cysteine desulfurase-like protein [Rhodospirillaceae bacterium]